MAAAAVGRLDVLRAGARGAQLADRLGRVLEGGVGAEDVARDLEHRVDRLALALGAVLVLQLCDEARPLQQSTACRQEGSNSTW